MDPILFQTDNGTVDALTTSSHVHRSLFEDMTCRKARVRRWKRPLPRIIIKEEHSDR